jgi:hypothetical protein
LTDEEFRNGDSTIDNELSRPIAVRRATRVASVQEVFIRQLQAERLKHRQPADTGIEDSYWFVICNHLPADVVLHSTFDNRAVADAYY